MGDETKIEAAKMIMLRLGEWLGWAEFRNDRIKGSLWAVSIYNIKYK